MPVPKNVEPKIEVRAEQFCVMIPISVNLREWGKANALVPQIFEWLQTNHLTPAGAPFFRYYVLGNMEEKFRLEVGVPIAHSVPCNDPVHPGTIPAGKYATLMHHGHPDRLVQSFDKLEKWAKNRDIKWDIKKDENEDVWAGRFEFFLTNPADQSDPEQWTGESATRKFLRKMGRVAQK